MCNCKRTCLTMMTRLVNTVIALIGVGLIIYAIVFAANASSFSVATALPLIMGAIDIALGAVIATCGYKRIFWLRLYMLICGLVLLGELTMAIVLLVPSTNEKLIDAMDLSDDAAGWVRSHITDAGYILLAIVGFKAFALFLASSQSMSVYYRFEEEEEAAEIAQERASMMKGKKDSLLSKADKFGALVDEGAIDPAAARYREKNSTLYEKYNIKRAAK